MTCYFLGIGSNDDAENNCRLMIEAIRKTFDDVRLSRVICTEAHGEDHDGAPDYYNAVACFESDWQSGQLNDWCKTVEQRLGRVRGSSLCRADLDILLAVDEMSKASTAAIEDIYFRPLVQELLLLLPGS
ncbi:MAG: 2-amino-4-hydroxy-6-hydroxymethyldihydropteridine diphosphokinase [Endozoicomonas sp.]